ncbi:MULTISPECIES: substrate-binding periplasmic protein [Deefgea]|nr:MULTISPECIES: transporter substrate-binding domain-containing protein [Deefgea]MBM9889318.1 transporter substrate-binding domain-containing protein [Deefgea sp. CFH1-16]
MLKIWVSALLGLAACGINAAPLQVSLPEIIPLSFITPEGQKLGLYVDLVNAISQESGIELQITITPFARSVNLINHGKADLAVHNTSAVQSSRLRNLGTLHLTDLVLWPNTRMVLSNKSQLTGQVVGRLRGGCQRVLDTSAVQFYDINHYEQGVKMLAAQRLDALCGSREAILFAIRRNALPALETGQPLRLEQMQVALLARQDLSQSQLERLERATRKIMKSALPQQLASRYGLK